MRNSFIFYESWWEAIKDLPKDVRGDVLTAIVEYGLTGNTNVQLKPITNALLTMAKAQIDVNNKRYENGKRGGRPKSKQNQTETKPKPNNNQNETKEKPNQNQNITKTEPKANQTETKGEPNVNDNVNDNDNENVIITPCSRDNSLCTTTTTSEGELDVYTKYIESSKKSQAWLERMGMNFHLMIPQVVSYMDEFRQDCLCRGVDDRHKTLQDFKQHFNNWLRIRIDKERQNNNGNRQSNGAAATREQRQAEAAQLVAEILARDN